MFCLHQSSIVAQHFLRSSDWTYVNKALIKYFINDEELKNGPLR